MSKKTFLKSAIIAVASIALTSGVSSCKMANHSCAGKNSCKSNAKEEKSSCKSGKHSCKSESGSKHSCRSEKK